MLSTASHHKPIGQVIARLVVQVTFFFAVECLLNAAGTDTIADYYEFVAGQSEIEILSHQSFIPPVSIIARPQQSIA